MYVLWAGRLPTVEVFAPMAYDMRIYADINGRDNQLPRLHANVGLCWMYGGLLQPPTDRDVRAVPSIEPPFHPYGGGLHDLRKRLNFSRH